MCQLAVIGLGRRAASLLAILRQLDADISVRGVADPDRERAAARLREAGYDSSQTQFFHDAEHLVQHGRDFDGVLIGARCSHHALAAVSVAHLGVPVLLEKPVAVTASQARSLFAAYRGRSHNVLVSFPLRYTPLFTTVLDIVRSGRLGTINQIQAINNVPYGGVYFGDWYRNSAETGDLWLQKATHDFDYINLLANCLPTTVAAVGTRRIFGGDRPRDLRCSQCSQHRVCHESPANLLLRGDTGGVAPDGGLATGELDHWCTFSEGIQHDDASSALILYQDAIHATYTQNFVTRRSAGRRGAIVTGYKGTLDFDWYQSDIRVTEHHVNRVDRIKVIATSAHGGGDFNLMQNFVAMLRQNDVSHAPLRDGLLSVAMCLAAGSSARHHRYEVVDPLFQERLQSVSSDDAVLCQ